MLVAWSTGRKVAAATAMVCALMIGGLVWVHHTIGFWDPSTGLVQHLCLRRETHQVDQMRVLGDPMFAGPAIRQHHDLSCGGQAGITDVSYYLPYRSQSDVTQVLGSAGWTLRGGGMTSPGGEFCAITVENQPGVPGLPVRHTEVQIRSCSLEDD